jgi:hypothetical protein
MDKQNPKVEASWEAIFLQDNVVSGMPPQGYFDFLFRVSIVYIYLTSAGPPIREDKMSTCFICCGCNDGYNCGSIPTDFSK